MICSNESLKSFDLIIDEISFTFDSLNKLLDLFRAVGVIKTARIIWASVIITAIKNRKFAIFNLLTP